MSKRAGEFITLDELLAEVGVDAARWYFASRGATTRHRLRHRAREEAVEREPRLLRPVRARPHRSILRKAAEAGPGAGAVRCRHRWPARRRRPWRGRSSGFRRWSRTRRRPRRPRASRPTRPSSRRRSTPSTATRGSSTRTSRSARRSGWRSSGGADHARQRPGPAGDLRARVDVAAPVGRASAGGQDARPSLGDRRRVVADAITTQRVVPPSPGSDRRVSPAPRARVCGGRGELGGVGRRVPCRLTSRPPSVRPGRSSASRSPPQPAAAPRRRRRPATPAARAARRRSGTRPRCPRAPTDQPSPIRAARSSAVDLDRRLAAEYFSG